MNATANKISAEIKVQTHRLNTVLHTFQAENESLAESYNAAIEGKMQNMITHSHINTF